MVLDVQLCTYLMARKVNPALVYVARGAHNAPLHVVYVKQPNAKRGKAVYSFLNGRLHPSGYGSAFVPCDVPLRACDEMMALIETFNNTGVMFALREVTK